jgi:serine/threonine protein kinase
VTKNYEILSKLGEGTFACVYRARHKRTQTNYAIKQIAVHPLVIEEELKEI